MEIKRRRLKYERSVMKDMGDLYRMEKHISKDRLVTQTEGTSEGTVSMVIK